MLDHGAMFDPATARALIESHRPLDPVAAYYQRQMLALINSTPDFANRYHYTPGHLTAQAVVYQPSTRRVAMMRHKKLNMDLFFGGHCEPEDVDLLAAARREALEEGGLDHLLLAQQTPFDLDIHGFPARKDQPDHLHFDVRFLFHAADDAVLKQNDESEQVYWLPVGELRTHLPMNLSNSRLVLQLERIAS